MRPSSSGRPRVMSIAARLSLIACLTGVFAAFFVPLPEVIAPLSWPAAGAVFIAAAISSIAGFAFSAIAAAMLILVFYCAIVTFLPKSVIVPYFGIGRFVAVCFGGITGPSTAFPGAIPTLWVSMTDLPKDLQRGFYQPYILIMQIAAITALAVAVPVQSHLQDELGYVLPALCGAHLGLFIFRRLSTPQFAIAVRVFLFVSGLGLMADILA